MVFLKSTLAAAAVSLFISTSCALDLRPIADPSVLISGHSKRDSNTIFDPLSANSFYWGVSDSENVYIANFTLYNPGDEEFILPLDNFAHKLKSVTCNNPMVIEFQDSDSFAYASSAWDWVNKNANHTFTLVTNPDQCSPGDDRSPFTVTDIAFDSTNLKATLTANESSWDQVAHTFRLNLYHQAQNETHARLLKALKTRDTKSFDISYQYNKNLFNYQKGDTNGLALQADAQISTGGKIVVDFDVQTKVFVPTDVNINIHPQGINAMLMLNLNADGKLGKGIDYKGPSLDIPVEALKIGKLLEIGPFVTLGVNVGSTALEGTAHASIGAKATLDDSATVAVDLRKPDQNKISGWTPHFQKIDPQFSAEIKGGMKAWVDMGIQLKADVLGKWGYQASVDAELPYFQADFSAQLNTQGVCNSKKTVGIDLNANVGIDVNLNAGEVNKAPSFSKDLFNTNWQLFTTCLGVGPDNAHATTVASTTAQTTNPASGTAKTTSAQITSTGKPANATQASHPAVSGPASTNSPASLSHTIYNISSSVPTLTSSAASRTNGTTSMHYSTHDHSSETASSYSMETTAPGGGHGYSSNGGDRTSSILGTASSRFTQYTNASTFYTSTLKPTPVYSTRVL